MRVEEEGNWDRYRQEFSRCRAQTPMANRNVYKKAVEILKDDIFSRDQLNILVGGIASGFSAEEFIQLWQGLRKGSKDQLLFLDQDFRPLREMQRLAGNFERVVGKLEELPFRKASIDVILLDFTLDFLSDPKLKCFLSGTKTVLKPDGIVIALIKDPVWPGLGNLKERIVFGVPSHMRTMSQYRRFIAPHFDVLYLGCTDRTGIFDSPEVGLIVFGQISTKSASRLGELPVCSIAA